MPNPIEHKNILLGVTGSIAAYKSADLASKLTQAGGLVDVILTPAALQFITPLTFQSVTGRKAYVEADLWGGEGHIRHIGLGTAGDLLLIAPASANTIAKLAHGIADNLLTITALAARCPVLIAPAMDAGMYDHPATQANIEILRQRGVVILGPAEGRMASGLVGLGRMLEPAELLGQVRFILSRAGELKERRVVVTAGGTQEPVDPVRVLSNRSSGKQGFSLAQAALDAGAQVTLIHTPVNQVVPAGACSIPVQTTEEMLQAVLKESSGADALIMAAAAADFRPAHPADQKIKKASGLKAIPLEMTPDILATLAQKTDHRPKVVIGFAAESQDLLENARQKLTAKQLDLIVANDISAKDAGFGVDTNRVTLIYPDGRTQPLPLASKADVAEAVITELVRFLKPGRASLK